MPAATAASVRSPRPIAGLGPQPRRVRPGAARRRAARRRSPPAAPPVRPPESRRPRRRRRRVAGCAGRRSSPRAARRSTPPRRPARRPRPPAGPCAAAPSSATAAAPGARARGRARRDATACSYSATAPRRSAAPTTRPPPAGSTSTIASAAGNGSEAARRKRTNSRASASAGRQQREPADAVRQHERRGGGRAAGRVQRPSQRVAHLVRALQVGPGGRGDERTRGERDAREPSQAPPAEPAAHHRHAHRAGVRGDEEPRLRASATPQWYPSRADGGAVYDPRFVCAWRTRVMKVYDAPSIRNVALVGHGGSGKTSLASALLFDAGAVNRLGRVEDGSTVTDFDPDEIERKISLQAALAFAEWKKAKINLIDTPGYANFLSEARAALRVVDAAHRRRRRGRRRRGADGEGLGLRRRVRRRAADRGEPHGPRERVVRAGARERSSKLFGRSGVPVAIPVGQEKGFKGVVDLVTQTAQIYAGDASGKFQTGEIPAEAQDAAKTWRDKLVEMVAESNEDLIEEFFEKGTLSQEQLARGCAAPSWPGSLPGRARLLGAERRRAHAARRDRRPPALARRPRRGEGERPGDRRPRRRASPRRTLRSRRSCSRRSSTRTPAASRSSACTPGRSSPTRAVHNVTRDAAERVGSLLLLQGKGQTQVPELRPATSGRSRSSRTRRPGDTLADKASPIVYPRSPSPSPRRRSRSSPRRAATTTRSRPRCSACSRRTRCCASRATRRRTRCCSRGWASCTSRWSWPGCASATRSRSTSRSRRSPTGRRSRARPRRTGATRSRPAATASSATARSG